MKRLNTKDFKQLIDILKHISIEKSEEVYDNYETANITIYLDDYFPATFEAKLDFTLTDNGYRDTSGYYYSNEELEIHNVSYTLQDENGDNYIIKDYQDQEITRQLKSANRYSSKYSKLMEVR